jgi:hypothetical protein
LVRSGQKRCFYEGQRLTTEISLHNPEPKGDGGTTTTIYGSKGSGKTTFLVTLAMNCGYIDPNTHQITKETVVWRGREIDYWMYFPKKVTTLFIHKDDIDNIEFRFEDLTVPEDKELPQIITYSSCKDLYNKFRRGQINVVYEPMTYTMTDAIKSMVQRRGAAKRELFENVDVSPVIFWFEMFDWIVRNKGLDPITIIFDEADELFPVSPGGARWHLNLWAKERIKDFRKKNISLALASHGYQDIDGRILVKIQYKIYMKGCTTPTVSLIDRHAPIMLDKGVYYVEKDAWGLAKFSRLPEHPKITTTFGSKIGEEPSVESIESRAGHVRDEVRAEIERVRAEMTLKNGAPSPVQKGIDRVKGIRQPITASMPTPTASIPTTEVLELSRGDLGLEPVSAPVIAEPGAVSPPPPPAPAPMGSPASAPASTLMSAPAPDAETERRRMEYLKKTVGRA